MTEYQPVNRPVQFRLRSGERKIILLVGDILITILALFIALYFWSQEDWLNFSWTFLKTRPPFWFYFLPVFWVLINIELYDIRRSSRRSDTIRGIAIAAAISFVVYLIIYFTSSPNSLPRRGVAGFIVSSAVLMLIWRFLYIGIFTAPQFMRRVMIVGAGRAGSTLAKVVREVWPSPFYLVGFIDDDPQKQGTQVEGFPVLGGNQDLMRIIEEQKISDLVFAISGDISDDMFRALFNAVENGIEINNMPMIYEEILGRVPIFLLEDDWLLRSFVDQAQTNTFYEMMKRIIDIAGGVVGTLIFIFTLPITSLLIILDTGTPVIYSQLRMGKNGRLYTIYKYRTMRQDSEKDGKPQVTVKNDERITRVGRFLRKSHMDELPQFINVLRGEMSLVGPRAERMELVKDLTQKIPFYRARLMVKPGLTGWAQVNFGYAETVSDTAIKLEYDLYYIKHRGILLDVIILLRTVGTVVGFRGQ
ncbi:MAG TPA: sugar transferase [Anaerolineaceae bacterium]